MSGDFDSFPSYYIDGKGILWKIQKGEYFYFSQHTLGWIKTKMFFVQVCFADAFIVSKARATEKIKEIKAKGKKETDDLPMFYFSDDNEWIYAIDANCREYRFNPKENRLVEDKNCVSLNSMKSGWGVAPEKYTKERMKELVKEYKKN